MVILGNTQPDFNNRSQTYNPYRDRYIKRDTTNGRFMSQKKTGGAYKCVRKENNI